MAASILFCTASATFAQQGAAPEDARQLVEMPPLAQAILREEMLDNLGALNELIGLLAEDRLQEAGTLAEQRLGQSSMGRHAARARGQGPGRFMPASMHAIALAMHDAATELGKVAQTGDEAKALAALQKVSATCVACHAAYRTR
jgi:hypothetical protein